MTLTMALKWQYGTLCFGFRAVWYLSKLLLGAGFSWCSAFHSPVSVACEAGPWGKLLFSNKACFFFFLMANTLNIKPTFLWGEPPTKGPFPCPHLRCIPCAKNSMAMLMMGSVITMEINGTFLLSLWCVWVYSKFTPSWPWSLSII